MNLKKIFFIAIIFAITSCGFQPIHLSKDTPNFAINEITEEGDKNINKKILLKINLKNQNKSKNKYNLAIKSSKKNEVISRDTNGNPLTYKISIQVEIILSDLEDPKIIFKQKSFNASFNYNDKGSKFSLSQYIKITESNLVDKVSKDIRIFLNI
mgnify:FL=1|tara:strand:- start:1493 stop:1957 length:465 start_codon:yes stop_codon:yes gene_type:complete